MPGTTRTGGERILVVTPYAPWRDGIGAYALQQVRRLRREGHHVEVLSPKPSAAHHHGDLRGRAGARLLTRLGRRFDRVILHFHPDVVYRLPPTGGSRIDTALAYGAAFRALPHVELRLHEIDHSWAHEERTAWATRWMLAGADLITVHSTEQRDQLVEGFRVPADRVQLFDHGLDFAPRTTADRAQARATLGLPADEHVFLCIGFVQPHKGFDRAARAFTGLGAAPGPERPGAAGAPSGVRARLDIVGSVRVTEQQAREHVAELRAIAAREPGIHLHLGFVSDEMFDRWIVAADTVVLPYRHIWSSSVAERAALFGRPVIATDVGGLGHQVEAMEGSVLVADNAGLARAMAAAVGRTGADVAPEPWPATGDRTRIQAEIEARATAARGGAASGRSWAGAGGERPALSAPVRRVGVITAPAPVSARPGVSLLKRLIRRVIYWEIQPLTDQVNRLQRATADALDQADAATTPTSEDP
ncbi:MAG TPA: glycosyltransferase family 4 protein [Iamia sp.]|nr:glycosyltransferase family 4 protein [Iamia sp.]